MTGTTRQVALVCTSDDPDLAARLRAATAREITPTLIVRTGDARALRLARAAGAEVGVFASESGSGPVLLQRGAPGPATAGRTVITPAGIIAGDAARTVRLVDDVAAIGEMDGGIALRDWDGPVLDGLLARGWRLGSVGHAPPTTPVRLDGVRALHLTSVHRPDDGRIFHKEIAALRAAGADATVLGLDPRPSRSRRAAAGWKLVAEARRRDVDVVHIHDPELLPAAWVLRRRTGRPVIYDAHEYLGQTTRTKPWIPSPLRTPTALAVERLERMLAGGIDAVVTVTEDMAVGFADAGIRAISVANYAPATRFPDPGPAPNSRLVVYVGGVSRARGLDVMLEAFAMVDVSDARLLLAGPGEPGPLPPRVEHVGWVDYDDVPALIRRAAVVWMPQRRTPNWDRARATKVMEAMASGRPVVTSDLQRTAAMVRQAGCGVVVPFDDPGAHAAALTELLRDLTRARQLGQAGRATFLDHMTFEAEAAKLVALYAELTG